MLWLVCFALCKITCLTLIQRQSEENYLCLCLCIKYFLFKFFLGGQGGCIYYMCPNFKLKRPFPSSGSCNLIWKCVFPILNFLADIDLAAAANVRLSKTEKDSVQFLSTDVCSLSTSKHSISISISLSISISISISISTSISMWVQLARGGESAQYIG